jgi:hypothetical protein
MHYLTGLVLSVFIGFHLINHLAALKGIEAHIEFNKILRLVYRNPVVEILLVTAVVIQIISGIKLYREKREHVHSAFEKLHLLTGLYLAAFLVLHVGAVFIGRTVLKLDTNFYFGAAGLNTFPFNLFFVPYYTLAIVSVFGHVASVHHQKMKRNVFGISPLHQARAILLVGAVLSVVVLYGLTNKFHGFAIPDEYGVMIGK